MTKTTSDSPAQPSDTSPMNSPEQPTSPAPDDEHVKLTPLLITLGIIAIVLGLGAGLLMSQATLFR